MQFIDESCIVFDDEEENKLEYTELHNKFKQLVDSLLAAHLLEVLALPYEFCFWDDVCNSRWSITT